MAALDNIADQAIDGRNRRRRYARWYRLLRDALGVGGVTAGVIAGQAASGDASTVTGIAGFAAGLFSGVLAFLNPGGRAQVNQDCATAYGDIALRAEILQGREAAPTQAELDDLRERITKVRGHRQPEERPPPSGDGA